MSMAPSSRMRRFLGDDMISSIAFEGDDDVAALDGSSVGSDFAAANAGDQPSFANQYIKDFAAGLLADPTPPAVTPLAPMVTTAAFNLSGLLAAGALALLLFAKPSRR